MEDIRFDDSLTNIEIEIPIINYLNTPSKLQCNGNNFNDFNGLTNLKVFCQHNDSHIETAESYIKEKIGEVAIHHLKQNISADLKEQYPPNTTYHLDSSIMNLLKDHIKSEIQFLRREIKEKNLNNRRYKKQQPIYFINFARSFVNAAHIFKLYD